MIKPSEIIQDTKKGLLASNAINEISISKVYLMWHIINAIYAITLLMDASKIKELREEEKYIKIYSGLAFILALRTALFNGVN